MNHIIFILYILCAIADMVIIVISGFLYRKFNSAVYKYLVIVMTGALFSLIVETVRIYSRIVPAEMGLVTSIVYYIFDPAGEILQFFFLPLLAYSIFDKKIPKALRTFTLVYAFSVILTFPLETVFDYNRINPVRDIFGFLVFYSFAYISLVVLRKRIRNCNLKKALKGYLILAAIAIPFAVIFEIGIYRGFISVNHSEIPFPYIFYCLAFNILCLVNAYKYIFSPVSNSIENLSENFLKKHSITDRENEIITLLLKGYNNDQISNRLCISSGTVKNHIYKIFQKIDVKNRTQLAYKIHMHNQ